MHEGPLGVFSTSDGNTDLVEKDYDDIQDKSFTINADAGFLGITDKFWITSIIPQENSKFRANFDFKNKFLTNFIETEATEIGANETKSNEIKILETRKTTPWIRLLEKYEADFGTAVLMEVQTGQIKAIVNLKKTPEYKYAEILNYAATRLIEPGSTMKLASLMAYFEDFGGSINDTVDCKNGKYRFKGAPINTYDSKKLGIASLNEVFAHSSNIGVGTAVSGFTTGTIAQFANTDFNACYAQIHVKDKNNGEVNYNEVIIDFDGTDTYIAETYTDASANGYSASRVGIITAKYEGGNIKIQCINDRAGIGTELNVRANIVGLGLSLIHIWRCRRRG